MQMQLHNLLIRQLNRLELTCDMPPADLKKWQTILEKVSKAYDEADQERYMIERSMDISSRELLDLNEKLETAQSLAGLGYWAYDKSNERITLSKELYGLFGLKIGEPLPTFEQLMQMVHEDERSHLKELIEKAFSEGTEFEYEIRLQRPNGEYRWYYIIGRPILYDKSGYVLSGIAMDITKRKKAEQEFITVNEQLVSVSRQIGMADIASATLHNVGNVLSSASVSADLLKEKVEQPQYKNLFSILNMLKEHLPTLSDYLIQDPKGKLIPQYLVSLGTYIEEDNKKLVQEIEIIKQQLQHIKDIIATQNNISRKKGITEKIMLSELIDSALQLSEDSQKFKHIKIEKTFDDIPPIVIDKNKFLQILVNLIKNAKEAVIDNNKTTNKQISISSRKNPQNKRLSITVEDNGVGILEENLTKIFSFGFTTKENGHGYGLHASALAAQEMGGKLSVESKGKGKGATFTLSLPLTSPA